MALPKPNLNGKLWLLTDKLSLIRVIPGLGTGINAAAFLTDLLLANYYWQNAKLRTQALSKHMLSLVGK